MGPVNTPSSTLPLDTIVAAAGLSIVLQSSSVYGIVAGLLGLQIMFMLVFLRNIDPKYTHTFYSTRSGIGYCHKKFTDAKEDEEKVEIFTISSHKWMAISSEVVEWLNSKIPEWNESQPEWWTDSVKATIPDWAVNDPSILLGLRTREVVEIRGRRGSINVLQQVSSVADVEGRATILNSPSTKRRRNKGMEARSEMRSYNESVLSLTAG